MIKIFLVEDDDSIREVLEIFLRSEDYTVHSFANVSEFKNRRKDELPDLYLFDVMLPDGSGIDLCKEIKNNDLNEGIPVIIMSAHAQLTQIKDVCNPDDFIAKPFDIDQLLQQIQKMVRS